MVAGILLSVSAAVHAAQPKMPLPSHDSLPMIFPGEYREVAIEGLASESMKFFSQDQSKFLPEDQLGKRFRTIEASDEEVRLLDSFVRNASQFPPVESKGTKKSEMANGRFVDSNQIGEVWEPSTNGGPSQRVSRFYKYSGKTVMLSEWDYEADKGGIVQLSNYLNAVVNGRPAVFLVKKSRGQGALWKLSWNKAPKNFQLYVHEELFDSRTADLVMEIASSVK